MHKPVILGATRLVGEARFILRDLMGRPVYDSGYKPNLITDTGLLNVSNSDNWSSYCRLGTSSAAPATTQTGLIAPIGNDQDSTRSGASMVINYSSPYEYSQGRGWRFDAGNGTGVIAEAAVFPSATAAANNDTVTSRVLVTPTINKTIDNVLDVFWKWTMYPQIVDAVTNGIDITEDGSSVLYNCISRGQGYYGLDGGYYGSPAQSSMWRQFGVFNYYATAVNDGVLGATVEDRMSGSNSSSGYWGTTYGTTTLDGGNGAYRDCTFTQTLDQANAPAGGFRCLKLTYDHNYTFGIQYDNVATPGRLVPKDNTKIMSLSVRSKWTR